MLPVLRIMWVRLWFGRVFLLTFCLIITIAVRAQQAVSLGQHGLQHIFSYNELASFEDASNRYSIGEVSSTGFDKFGDEGRFIPKNYHYSSTYWYRIKIKGDPGRPEDRILEFYDPSIEHIDFFSSDGNGGFAKATYGAGHPFSNRLFQHKNITILLKYTPDSSTHTYFFSIRSSQPSNIMVVLKSEGWFVEYGLKEYLFSGVFYGMILVFCLYNLVMFFAFRQRQYLYYIAYNLSIGVFEMSSNGIAYQYLWPNAPGWNVMAAGVALYSASLFSLLFTREFLSLRQKAPLLNKLIWVFVGLRTLFFFCCLFINQQWFIYKFLDAIPLVLAFYSGIYVLREKYYPARFFVAGYSFLFLGFTIRVLKTLATQNLPFGPLNFYSLTFCFLMEMLFVSFAIGDKVKWLRKAKDLAHKRMIAEMEINQQLKDNLNKELEKKVAERTREVREKSAVIEQQNEELVAVNELLKQQAEEISRMNEMLQQDNEVLQQDNEVLQVDIKKVTAARVLSAEMDFPEFSRIYPDDEAGLKFLADLKWQAGYICRKCENTTFFNGHLPYSRRCSKCSYEESATTNTLFQNAHIPLNKAFYIAYLVYATKGKISSYKLSSILSIRQSTCWSYAVKVKRRMEERRKEVRNAGEKGWSKLVLEKAYYSPSDEA